MVAQDSRSSPPREAPPRAGTVPTRTTETAESLTDPAQAADGPLTGPDDIIVTAQRRSESLQRVPLSVSVVTGESLAREDVRTLEDLSARTPNLRIVAATLSDQLHIRGTGSGFNTGFEQSVATFVDGVYRSRSRSSRVALFDVDRVEVLKGPQTIFFGANAIAGAISITTRKPSDELEVNGTALYAPTDGEYNVEAGVGGPVSDTLSLRLSGRVSGMDGYIRNVRYGSDGPDLDDKQGRLSAQWTPTSRLTVNARFDIARLRDTGTFEGELFSCPPSTRAPTGQCARNLNLGLVTDNAINYRSASSSPGSLTLDLEEGAIGTRLDFEPFSINATTSYSHQRAVNTYEVAPFPGLSPIGTPSYLYGYSGENFRQFSQELRLESAGTNRFDYMVGGYYEYGKLNTNFLPGNFLGPFGALAPGVYNATTPIASRTLVSQRTSTISGFASATFEIVPRLKLTGSLRYTRVRKSANRDAVVGSSGAFPAPDNFIPGPASVQATLGRVIGVPLGNFPITRRVDDEFMPAANVRYEISEDVMTYASYTHGFKAGGYAGATPDIFAPETVDSYEAGVKARWLDRRVTTNIAVFRADYSDLQEAQNIVSTSGAPIQIITNAAKSRASGVEFSGSVRASDRLTLRADVAYLDSTYVRYLNAPCSPLEAAATPNCLANRSGDRRAYAPEFSGSTGVDYELPLGDFALRLGGTVYFTTGYFQQPATSDLVRQSGYAKLDLRTAIGPQDGAWELAVIGKNVTDKTTSGYRNYAPTAIGSAYGIAERPASVAVQLTGRW